MSLRGPLALFGIAVLGLGAIAALVWIRELGQAEILLTLLVIAGVVILLAALGGLVALLSGFGMHDRREALGLPQGSIRAVIALSLILIFAMISVFLVGAMRGEIRQSTGLTEAQVTQLGSDRILRIVPGASAGTFDVETMIQPSDMSQQLLTILGTLVTALVAFYFGQHSVTTAASVMKNVAGGPSGGVAGAVVGGAAGAAAGAAAGGAAGAAAGAGEADADGVEVEFEGDVAAPDAAGAEAGAAAGGAAGAAAGAVAGEAAAAAERDAEQAADAAAADPVDARAATAEAEAAAAEANAAAADAESAAKDAKDAKTLSEDEI